MRAFGVSIPQIINAIATNNAMSQSVNTAIGQVPGIRDPAAFNLIGQPNLVIRIDRAKAARYAIRTVPVAVPNGDPQLPTSYIGQGEVHLGISVSDVNAVVPRTLYFSGTKLKLEGGASYISPS